MTKGKDLWYKAVQMYGTKQRSQWDAAGCTSCLVGGQAHCAALGVQKEPGMEGLQEERGWWVQSYMSKMSTEWVMLQKAAPERKCKPGTSSSLNLQSYKRGAETGEWKCPLPALQSDATSARTRAVQRHRILPSRSLPFPQTGLQLQEKKK